MRTDDTGEIISAETIADAVKLINTTGANVEAYVEALGCYVPISKKGACKAVAQLFERRGGLVRVKEDGYGDNVCVAVTLYDVAETAENVAFKWVTIS